MPADNRRYDDIKHVDLPLMIRLLAEATKADLKVVLQNLFRPNMTIYHLLDGVTQNAANILVQQILGNEDEFLEHLNTRMLLALVSTKHDLKVKVPVVNLLIKWIILNQVDTSILNTILMSLTLPYWNLENVIRLKMSLYVYFTTPELNEYFNIKIGEEGDVCINKKKEIPSEEYPKTLIEVCRNINKITDNHRNPMWPQGTLRNNPEILKFNNNKVVLPKPIQSFCQISNPLYKWGFDIAEEMAQKKLQLLNKPIVQLGYKLDKSDENENSRFLDKRAHEADEGNIVSSGYSTQKKLMKPISYQKIDVHKSSTASTGTSSSGYHSTCSSRIESECSPEKDSNRTGKTVRGDFCKSIFGHNTNIIQEEGSEDQVQNLKNNQESRKNIRSEIKVKSENNKDDRIPVAVRYLTGPFQEKCSNKIPNIKESLEDDLDMLQGIRQETVSPVPDTTSESAVLAFLAKRKEKGLETSISSEDSTEKNLSKFFFDTSTNVIEIKRH